MRSLPQNLVFDPPWGGAESMGVSEKSWKTILYDGWTTIFVHFNSSDDKDDLSKYI